MYNSCRFPCTLTLGQTGHAQLPRHAATLAFAAKIAILVLLVHNCVVPCVLDWVGCLSTHKLLLQYVCNVRCSVTAFLQAYEVTLNEPVEPKLAASLVKKFSAGFTLTGNDVV